MAAPEWLALLAVVGVVAWIIFRKPQPEATPHSRREETLERIKLEPETPPRPRQVAPLERRASGVSQNTKTWASASNIEAEDDEDDYSDFVQESWAAATIQCGDISVEVNGAASALHSLTPSPRGHPYANLFFGPSRARKTLATDNRHRWAIGGHRISPSVFRAIIEGRAGISDIRPDEQPDTLEEALAFDRFPAKGRRMALQYRSADDIIAWRIISRLQRGPEELYALCHLRWGDSRTFRYDRILTLIDIETGQIIDINAYLAKQIDLPGSSRRKSGR